MNPKFQSIIKLKHSKFTVILGSGLHKQALGESSILSSWIHLLKNLDKEIELSNCYPLDFEQLIIRKSQELLDPKNQRKANEMEDVISKEICFDLKCAQQKALCLAKEKYPSGIFNPDYVSDIISLNFDSLALELCSEMAGVEITSIEPIQFSYKGKKIEGVFYYEVKFSKTQSIRFWFPHGSILDETKITLGTRNYAMRLQNLEKLRGYSKSKEREEHKSGSSKTGTSWYHQLTHSPVLILGAEMSPSEWDIWFAFVNRERNFAKKSNLEFNYPIFQMRDCECKNDAQHQWFNPLFTGLSFDQQWSELEKIFKQNLKSKK
ncbi:MAG: hypothetical protein RLZZ531_1279 [Bacteroidota bacterium]|jgi:transposase-like protein